MCACSVHMQTEDVYVCMQCAHADRGCVCACSVHMQTEDVNVCM